MLGDDPADEFAARASESRQPARLPTTMPPAAVAQPVPVAPRGLAFLRNVFPVLRAN
jgi:hypothetical protein